MLTLGELEKGISKLPPSTRRAELEIWLHTKLLGRFEGRVLPIDAAVVARWGSIAGLSEAKGQPLPVIDGLLAATSLHYDLVIATRNVQDLERCGARCFNPWVAA